VHLYRPFSLAHFAAALPDTVKSIAVLDRTKEHGSLGEPLYMDVVTALAQANAQGIIKNMPVVIGGRYGLSSKEFTPQMVSAIFKELAKATPKPNFTVGIIDDVTHLSLEEDTAFEMSRTDLKTAVFYGLGSDGTVGANKNSIKIIAEATGEHAQGYFVYDSKKAGSTPHRTCVFRQPRSNRCISFKRLISSPATNGISSAPSMCWSAPNRAPRSF